MTTQENQLWADAADWFNRQVGGICELLTSEFPQSTMPDGLQQIIGCIGGLLTYLRGPGARELALARLRGMRPEWLPVLKRALLEKRLAVARDMAEQREKTNSMEVVDQLNARVKAYDDTLVNNERLRDSEVQDVPPISNYLTSKALQTHSALNLNPREYDEKFGTLLAPTLFKSDLRSY